MSLKIAVFIDFDNIEIGVKTTLNMPFDISAILEGVKERGEVITKVAYGDWKRAGDYGRLLSQHAIRMVQRNVTPGGDKNGADINLALDALEMAFTHHHINAFVIVGGDSDFITLVEKLKQYDKKVFVVGGRQFTSLVMQKNCHEFIAYENLIGSRRPPATERRPDSGAPVAASAPADVAKAIPLLKRALKVLVDREVEPQLGLLKSTLLQLDSTFSERDYGAGTFRDFIEKVSRTGVITLRHAGRSTMVDLAERNELPEPSAPQTVSAPANVASGEGRTVAPPEPPPAAVRETATPEQSQQAVAVVRDLLQRATPTRWPMYVRQLKPYLRGVDETFDERKYGFQTLMEFLRACQREGVLRLDRDRRGVLRLFPGKGSDPMTNIVIGSDPIAAVGADSGAGLDAGGAGLQDLPDAVDEPVAEAIEIVDAEPVEVVVVESPAERPARVAKSRTRARKPDGDAKPRARRPASRTPRKTKRKEEPQA